MTTNMGFAPGTFLDFKERYNVKGKWTISLLCKLDLGNLFPWVSVSRFCMQSVFLVKILEKTTLEST